MPNDIKNCNLPTAFISEVSNLAKLHGVKKVILFGSRARGDNRPTSDIDLAVCGGNVVEFRMDINEKTSTLLEVDVIDVSNGVSKQLKENIKREGIEIYAEN